MTKEEVQKTIEIMNEAASKMTKDDFIKFLVSTGFYEEDGTLKEEYEQLRKNERTSRTIKNHSIRK